MNSVIFIKKWTAVSSCQYDIGKILIKMFLVLIDTIFKIIYIKISKKVVKVMKFISVLLGLRKLTIFIEIRKQISIIKLSIKK